MQIGGIVKTGWKWVATALLLPPLLLAGAAGLLYCQPVQQWAVGKAAEYASEQTGMEVSVRSVRLVFPLDIALDGVLAVKHSEGLPLRRDTVAGIGCATLGIRLLPLLGGVVVVDDLRLEDSQINTLDFIPSAHVAGDARLIALQSRGVDIAGSVADLDCVELSGAHFSVALADSVPQDTSRESTPWRINVGRLAVDNSSVEISMPGDSVRITAGISTLTASTAEIDLGKGTYRIGSAGWEGYAAYDEPYSPHSPGMVDPGHLALSRAALSVDSVAYTPGGFSLCIRSMAVEERGGLAISGAKGRVEMDSAELRLPAMEIRTADSRLAAQLAMPLNAFADSAPGRLSAKVEAYIAKRDLAKWLPKEMQGLARRWPERHMAAGAVLEGNLERMDVRAVSLHLPGALDLSASGRVENLADEANLSADISLKANARDMGFAAALLPKSAASLVRIPRDVSLVADAHAAAGNYSAVFTVAHGGGSLSGEASFKAATADYSAELVAKALPLAHFVAGYPLAPFSGRISANGRGTDFMSPKSSMEAGLQVGRFSYGEYRLDGVAAVAKLAGGKLSTSVTGDTPFFSGSANLQTAIGAERFAGTLWCDVAGIDFHALHLADSALSASVCAHVDFDTDFKRHFYVKGTIDDITVKESGRTLRPAPMYIDLLSTADTTHAVAYGGDFRLVADAPGTLETLAESCSGLLGELQKQVLGRTIDKAALQRRLPTARISLQSGGRNLLANILNRYGADMAWADVNVVSSPQTGLNGLVGIDSLTAAGVRIDTIRLAIATEDSAFSYKAKVANNKRNPQYTFKAVAHGSIRGNGTELAVKLYDKDGRTGAALSAEGRVYDNGIMARFLPGDHVLGYTSFHVNDSNYLYLGRDRRVRADISLAANDGTAIRLFSGQIEDALQDITLSLNQFDLKKILSALPYMPDVEGLLNGDFHVVQTAENTTVNSLVDIKGLTYSKSRMGDVAAEFVYMPNSDGSHYIDGILQRNGEQVASLSGSYHPAGAGVLDATLMLERTPLLLANGFIPDRIVSLRGYAEGELTVRGRVDKPVVNGEVFLDSAYVRSPAYGVTLRFDNDPVLISDSRLLLENFNIYANDDSPLVAHGAVDFSDPAHAAVDLRMMARNFLLIDSKERFRSEVFGKAFVNFFGSVKGPADNLSMRGKLDVLGATDITYVLRDTPLANDNALDGIVRFKQEGYTAAAQPVAGVSGFNMDLSIGIDEGAHVVCALNADKTNYVDIVGGGDLRMRYSPAESLRLTGRYTLTSGEMKYSLPVIPLKTFTIQDGSYVEFTGDAMNPTLNITATEAAKATVATDGGAGRTVDFTCGVAITKTLADMGLEFVVDAPQDMAISGELKSMTKEERGKIAVTMLTTGMYITDGSVGNFSMNSALTSFLQSQINGIAGNALKTLDLSFGMDNTIDAGGNQHTDYSFKFSKRLWNNRLRIVVGGKLSSGADAADRNGNFLDNVQLEYRLNKGSTQYLNVFYERDSYDWLDGDVSKYGGGFVWRRKLQTLGELFRPARGIMQYARPKETPDTAGQAANGHTPTSTRNENNAR